MPDWARERPDHIRDALTEKHVAADSSLAQFVGLKAYEQAGGAVLRDLFDDFCTCCNEADIVIIADVYSAGEPPIDGADRDALVAGMRAHGHRNVQPLPDPKDLAPLIHELARSGDFVVCLGAGSITNWAQALPGELDRIAGIAPKTVGAGG